MKKNMLASPGIELYRLRDRNRASGRAQRMFQAAIFSAKIRITGPCCVLGISRYRLSEDRKIYVVDDDADIRDSMRVLLESAGLAVQSYASATLFLADHIPNGGCLISDVSMPDMSGLELQEEIAKRGIRMPVIIITGHGDVPLAVRAMRAGAIDFLEKPFDSQHMLNSVQKALEAGQQAHNRAATIKKARDKLALLTPREQDVLDCLVKGRSNKIAAHELGISPRTIEIHRSRIMDKMGAGSLSDLVRDSLAAEQASEENHGV